jgi:hypothetical protein
MPEPATVGLAQLDSDEGQLGELGLRVKRATTVELALSAWEAGIFCGRSGADLGDRFQP